MNKKLINNKQDLDNFVAELKKLARVNDLVGWYIETPTSFPCVAMAKTEEDEEGFFGGYYIDFVYPSDFQE